MLLRFRLAAATAPLLVNGYALVANAGLTSILGVVFWMLATRLYTQDQVGLAAALISSMTTISYLTQMNLGSLLTRFLPTAGQRASGLILKTYLLAGLAAALVATAFSLGIGVVAEPLEVLKTHRPAMFIFIAATVVWTIFALQDAALSGLRKSVWVPVENAIFSSLKILCLVGLAFYVLDPPGGIYLAWTLPLIPIVLGINGLIFWNLRRNTNQTASGQSLDLSTAARFLGWDFVGTLALASAFGLAPLMITATVGVAANATYHLAWTLTYSVYLVGRSISIALVAEGAANPQRLHRLIVDSLGHALALVTGAVLVMVAAAPLIMGLFGQVYATEGAAVLRILALSCIPWVITTIYVAVARVQRQTLSVALVQISTLAVFTAVSALLLSRLGALGVAYGWLVAHTTICLGVVIATMLRGGPGVVIDWGLAIAGSLARLVAGASGFLKGGAEQTSADAARFTNDSDHPSIAGKKAELVPVSLSDVSAVLLKTQSTKDAPQELRSVLKFSSTEYGIQALKRNAGTLRQLAKDKSLGLYRDILPLVELEENALGGYRTVETAARGTEGRAFMRDERARNAAMSSALLVMSEMHRRTASVQVIDEAWAQEWIDAPIELAKTSANTFWTATGRTEAYETLRLALRTILLGREKALGLGHGDFWPGNLFFTASDDNPDDIALSGLIDWDASRPNALAAFDACHLGFAVRMLNSGEELGPVVTALLRDGGWTSEETDMFMRAGIGDQIGRPADRELGWAIIVLTWLHHVQANISKSQSYAQNRLWSAVNVDRVLATVTKTMPPVPS